MSDFGLLLRNVGFAGIRLTRPHRLLVKLNAFDAFALLGLRRVCTLTR